MPVTDIQWSETEQHIAEVAFQTAYDREVTAIKATVQEKAAAIAAVDDLWRLHDFLSARRHDIDGKYDFAYAGLIFTLARLVQEGWLRLDELDGLDASKLAKVAALSRMGT